MATAVDPKVKEETLELIRRWPAPDVADILARLQDLVQAGRKKGYRPPLDRAGIMELDGCLATDGPAPTDEDCDRILEEELMRKHLRP